MKNLNLKSRLKFTLFCFICISNIISGQRPIGRIFDQASKQSFTLYENGMIVQDGNIANKGQTVRDPSGFMYLMLPSTQPTVNSFFLNWNNQLVQINRMNGISIIGYCQCPPIYNPYANIYQPPQYSQNIGVRTSNVFQPLPNVIVDKNKPYGNIMNTSEEKAQQCYQQNLDYNGLLKKENFGNCMIQNLAGEKDLQILNCIKNSDTPDIQTICMVGVLGGTKERQISQKLLECYKSYGTDYNKYALCLAGTTTDPNLMKLISCVEQQSKTGQVTFMNTAICYGASSLKLNPEMQIVVGCAIASGGEPYSFAGCAGGQLLTRELDKCFTNGIGGDQGCFGKNNEITKGLTSIGEAINVEFGPNNDLTRTWNNSVNDIKNGPGPNNDAVKVIRDVSNEVEKGVNNVKNEIERVIPHITF